MLIQKWMLFLFVISGFSIAAIAQEFEKKDKEYFRKGYKVTVAAPYDAGMAIIYAGPQSVNGEHIYGSGEITFSEETEKDIDSFTNYFLSNLIQDIESLQLPNCRIQIDPGVIVFDTSGKVVYYEYRGIIFYPKSGYDLSRKPYTKLAPKIMQLMTDAPVLKPFAQHGGSINIATGLSSHRIEIKNKRATIIYTKH